MTLGGTLETGMGVNLLWDYVTSLCLSLFTGEVESKIVTS